MIPNERMLKKQLKVEQTEVTVQCTSGIDVNQQTLFLQEGYYLNSIQLQNVDTSPLLIWVEYFFDRNESTKGEILDLWWTRNTSGYGYSPTKIINKLIGNELSKIVFNVINQSGTDETAIFVVTYSEQAITQTSTYDWENDRGIWQYNDLLERTDTNGVFEVDFTPAAGSWFELEQMKITATITSAAITITVQDGGGLILKTLSTLTTATGTWEIPILATSEEDNTASTPSSIGKTQDKLRITYPQTLNITTASITADEDLLILMTAKLKDVIPTITFGTNSQQQAGYSATRYSKVI